jgi:hypothetical protein
MKNKFLMLTVSIFAAANIAQAQMPGDSPYAGTMTFFTDEGEKFTLYLNGEQVNQAPAARVVAQIKDASVSLRIVFEDVSLPQFKKTIMRMAKDCTYMISKNKKGEYTSSMKSCTGTLDNGNTTMTTGTTTTAMPTDGPLTAKYQDGVILLSDGSRLTVTKVKTNGMWPSPHVKMTVPVGAKVSITYDDNKETYNTEVPFDYEVKDYNNNNSYFKLTVDQGGPDKTWYVRLQNGTGYMIKIE